MLIKNKKDNNYQVELINIDTLVPENHFLRILERNFNFDFIYEHVAKFYSTVGRPSIDPVVLIKMHMLKFLFNINSMRKTYEHLQYNILFRWFIGYSVDEKVPHFSTYSKNYKRKYSLMEKDILEIVFEEVINLLEKHKCLDMTEVYIDSTHIKASANKKKYHKEVVNVMAKKYTKELDEEIAKIKNTDDEPEPPTSNLDKEEKDNFKCNEQVNTEEVIGTKEIVKSDTDPDSGVLYKDEKEKMFAYNATVICEKNNYIVAKTTNPSNVHDSVAFYDAYENLKTNYEVDRINYLAGDAAYITPHICKTVLKDNIKIAVPYKRPMTKKSYFKKYDYVYDEHFDVYLCPDDKILERKGINKDGYIIYKANKEDCKGCKFKEKCTKTKNKIVTRHVWEEYKEIANDLRHHNDVKEVYKNRSSHIERVFADGKEKFGLRKVLTRGKKRVERELALLFACMNLRKFTLHRYY